MTLLQRAIEDAVRHRLTALGVRPVHVDGHRVGRWMALDYGGFVMHLLLPEAREFYRLDHLWENPRRIAWQEQPARKRKAVRA